MNQIKNLLNRYKLSIVQRPLLAQCMTYTLAIYLYMYALDSVSFHAKRRRNARNDSDHAIPWRVDDGESFIVFCTLDSNANLCTMV